MYAVINNLIYYLYLLMGLIEILSFKYLTTNVFIYILYSVACWSCIGSVFMLHVFLTSFILLTVNETSVDHFEFIRSSHWPRIQTCCRLRLSEIWGQGMLIIPQCRSHINTRPPLCHEICGSEQLPAPRSFQTDLEWSVLDLRWKVQKQTAEDAVFMCSDKTTLICAWIFDGARSELYEDGGNGKQTGEEEICQETSGVIYEMLHSTALPEMQSDSFICW